MFKTATKPTGTRAAITIFTLVYHSVVRNVRQEHNNAFLAIALNVLQMLIFVLVLYLMFSILGLRGSAIRGDFLLYIMSGVFLYMTHVKSVQSMVGSEGPTSAMMKHAPMNTVIAILSSAFGALYIQVLSLVLILFGYHVAFVPVEIYNPRGAFAMLLLAWFTGCAVGLVLLALKPWFPTAVGVIVLVYKRANMIASGKMFLANTLPSYMLAMFDWNPLFHAIDQARGFMFINYFPRYSNWEYAFWVGVVLVMIGLMGEFYTRAHASASWYARR